MAMGQKYGIEWWILVVGAAIILIILSMAIFANQIAPFDPYSDVGPQLEPPGGVHLMGTDSLQRDVWSRIVHGSSTILKVCLTACLISLLLGVILGLISGFVGGAMDRILSLLMDSLYSFPGLILAIAFAAMLGPGIINITIAVALIYIPIYFRMVRSQTLTIKEELYVEAAKASGAPTKTIIWEYIFPNIIPTIAVVFTVNVADAIVIEAALNYLGLGLPPTVVDWGMDLAQGKNFVASGQWWIIVFPGVMITTLSIGFTMLGEGLSEILNPRLLER
jgi:peptide/nickel transport system permease protein